MNGNNLKIKSTTEFFSPVIYLKHVPYIIIDLVKTVLPCESIINVLVL